MRVCLLAPLRGRAAACSKLGYEVVEVNASDTRNKSDPKGKGGIAGKTANRIRELVTNSAIGGANGARKQVLIMDEVDGMSGAGDVTPLRSRHGVGWSTLGRRREVLQLRRPVWRQRRRVGGRTACPARARNDMGQFRSGCRRHGSCSCGARSTQTQFAARCTGGDRGGVSDLIANIKLSKMPIICICNDKYKQSLKSLKNHCLELGWNKPTKLQVAGRLRMICKEEGLDMNQVGRFPSHSHLVGA